MKIYTEAPEKINIKNYQEPTKSMILGRGEKYDGIQQCKGSSKCIYSNTWGKIDEEIKE